MNCRGLVTVAAVAFTLWANLSAALFAQAEPPASLSKRATGDTPLLVEPKTPEETFRTIVLLVDLARNDLAKKCLTQFMDATPSDELLLKLRNQFGTATFQRLSRIEDLQPESQTLFEQLLDLTRRQVTEPEFVEALLKKLEGNDLEQYRAMEEFRRIGAPAVPGLVRRIAAGSLSGDDVDRIIQAMIGIGQPVVLPLVAALDAPPESVRHAAMITLGQLRAKEAVPFLWYASYSRQAEPGIQAAARTALAKILFGNEQKITQLSSVAATAELRRLAKRSLKGDLPYPRTGDLGEFELWAWSETAGTVVKQNATVPVASLQFALRFGRYAHELSPDLLPEQTMYLTALLEQSVRQRGITAPLPTDSESPYALLLNSGEEVAQSVLTEALADRRYGAAVAAATALGQCGSRKSWIDVRSPLLAALRYPDPRIQFAAATAILQLEPDQSFRGAEQVVAVLRRSLRDSGGARAVIIDADTDRAESLAGFVAEAGFEPQVAKTGREGFQLAVDASDLHAIFVHMNCNRWDLSQTLANLRADSRSAMVPIVLYGSTDLESAGLRTVTRLGGPITFVTEVGSAAHFREQVAPFLENLQSPALNAAEQARQRVAAAYWLAHLSTGFRSRVFDISSTEGALFEVLEDPDVARNALVALGGLQHPSVQRGLLNALGNRQLPVATREMAANQLAFHLQRYGVLFTQEDVKTLRKLIRDEDQSEVKTVLSAVAGLLRPDRRTVGAQLKKFKPLSIGAGGKEGTNTDAAEDE